MDKHSQDNLAEVIHRELRKLPERPAPETLINRVFARLEERKRQWWKQPWTSWPFLARVISLPAMLACVASLLVSFWFLFRFNVRDWLTTQANELVRPAVPAWDFGMAVLNTVMLSLRSLESYWILISLTVAFLMYLTCVAVGTVCVRVALPKR